MKTRLPPAPLHYMGDEADRTALPRVRQGDLGHRDLILIGGRLFLLWKSILEIHDSLP